MTMNHKIIFPSLTVILLTGIVSVAQAISIRPAEEYNPSINPEEFSTNINNPYFSIPVGKKMVYEAQTAGGTERIEILVPGWTAKVMGVETLVYWDRVYRNGVLHEDTRDYLAQSKNGDVWYFGENVNNYDNGKFKDHHGSWIAGVDGAKPGLWMVSNPQVGDEFRNEYYKSEAEDISKIVSANETVTVPFGTFTGCVKTFDSTPLEPTKTAHKYFCKQPVGGTALEVELPTPQMAKAENSELISVDMKGALGVALPAEYVSEGVVASGESDIKTENTDTGEHENYSGWITIILSGLVGLVGGVLLQKFVLGKIRSTENV